MFRQDSWLTAALGQVASVAVRNLLWLLTALLVLPAGAGLAALHALTIRDLEGDDTHQVSRFWTAFRAGFAPATAIWVVDLVLGALLLAEWSLLGAMAAGWVLLWLRSLVIIAIVVVLGTNVWCWSLLGRRLADEQTVPFAGTIRLVRDGFLAFIKYLPRTMVGVLAIGVPLLGLLFGPVWALRVGFYLAVIGVGVAAQLGVLALRRQLVREIPDLDESWGIDD